MKKALKLIDNWFTHKKKENVWGIIVPHTENSQGASNKIRKTTEYSYGITLVTLMNFPWETRNSGGVNEATKQLINRGCNCSLEPHKNAFNTKVSGFELLVLDGDKKSEEFAKTIVEKFRNQFPSRKIRHQDGILRVKKGDRGYNNLKIAKDNGMKMAILSESFFIDNDKDWISPNVMAEFWTKVLS